MITIPSNLEMAEQFVLRWHRQEHTLLGNLPYLLDTEILTDITLSVGCHSIKAHRLVLATCSTYFLELFQVIECFELEILVDVILGGYF